MSRVLLRRGLRDGDLDALSSLTATSPTAPLGPRRLQELLLAPGQGVCTVHVAERDGAPVGYVHLAAEHAGAEEAWIVSGAVAPLERGRGVGGTLLRAALDEARALGARTVRISGRPQGYAAPGVDAEQDPGTARFLEARGAPGRHGQVRVVAGRPSGPGDAPHPARPRTGHDRRRRGALCAARARVHA